MIDEDILRNRKILILSIVALFIIIFFVLLFIVRRSENTTVENNYVREKERTNMSSNLVSYLPEITIDSSDAKKVNKELEELYTEAITTDFMQFTYQYSINNNYFSLVAITNSLDENDYPYSTFKSYVFNTKTNNLVTDEELLSSFNKTKEELIESFNNSMREYYDKEQASGYLPSECDYNCFLSLRDISDEINLFVDNNRLKFYRSFKVYTLYQEEDFYRREDFLFMG